MSPAASASSAPRAWEPRDIPLADGRIIEIKARRAPNGNAILLWADVTAARHQLTRLGEAIKLVRRRFRLFRLAGPFSSPATTLYAQLAGLPLEELSGRSFEMIVTEVGP